MGWLRELEQSTIVPEGPHGFAQCHASTLLELKNGDLLCAYMAGSGEGEPDMAIWLSRRTAGEWGPPQRILAEEGLPHWNPVLHAEGPRSEDGERVRLYYKVGQSVQEWITRESLSSDGGASWSTARESVPGDPTPRVCVRAKLIVDRRGRWIGPLSVEAGDAWDSFVDISEDGGQTWRLRPIPLAHRVAQGAAREVAWQGLAEGALWENNLETVLRWDGVIQPTLWESAPGMLHALMRSTRGRIYRSDSEDGGESWCEAYPTELPNNNAGIDIVKLEDGALVLAYNPVAGNWDARTPLSLSLSRDGGETFSPPEHVETRPGEYSYPAIIARGNRLALSYTSNRTNIVVATFVVGEEGSEGTTS